MGTELLRYDTLIDGALRGVVREALRQVAEHGAPGDHHFYLSFRTGDPGVSLPDQLLAQYPEEMTIVLQNQFWDLEVREDAFEVTLSFAGRRQRLAVPFAALTGFADPSVKFGLQFQGVSEGAAVPAFAPEEGEGEEQAEAAEEADRKATVVTLDAFRKK